MRNNIENGESVKSVEISQGTLFAERSFKRKVTKKVRVITDIGEGNGFYSALIRKSKDGVYFGLGGTGFPEVFGRVVGQMSPEEVIEAARLGAKILGGYELSETQIVSFQKAAQQGSRILILNR